MAEDKNIKATIETADSAVLVETISLSRKRTRDDVEEEEETGTDEVEQREIKQLKRNAERIQETHAAGLVESGKAEAGDPEPSEGDTNFKGDREKKIETNKGSEKLVEEPQESKDDEKEVHGESETGDSVKTQKGNQEPAQEKKQEEKFTVTAEKPKFVFGAATPFGVNAFSLLNKNKNVSESKESTPTASNSVASVFGSSSTFGNAFQSAINKKSIFDEPEEANDKSDSKDTTATKEAQSSSSNDLYKKVDLEKKEVKSGEEDEEQVFTCRAKLYCLDLTDVEQGWKERGVGNVHVNKGESHSSRIIMRSNGLLKVILNVALVSGLEILKGMPSSLQSEKFIRFTSMDKGKPVQYAIKTGSVETTQSLYDSLIKLIPIV
jgi:Ran-binding protein 3